MREFKGREDHHKEVKESQPVIQLDFCFSRSQTSMITLTMLTVVDLLTMLMLGIVVPSKGAITYAIDMTKRFLMECGRTYGILQSDNEPAIKDLVRAVAAQVPGLSIRFSPKYSSKSLGAVGAMQKELYGQVRVLKRHIEVKYSMTLPPEHALLTWLVEHAAWLLNRYKIHTDGKTSFQRRWSKTFQSALCEFAETIQFRKSVWNSAGMSKAKLDVQWDFGLWLGRDTESNECLVGTSDGRLERCRSVRRLPPSQKYDKRLIDNFVTKTWERHCRPKTITEGPRLSPPPGLDAPVPESEDVPDADLKNVRPVEPEYDYEPEEMMEGEAVQQDFQDAMEVDGEELPSGIVARIAHVMSIETPTGTRLDVAVNETKEEYEYFAEEYEPTWFDCEEEEMTQEEIDFGDAKEFQSIEDFEVKDDVDANHMTYEQVKDAIPTRMVRKKEAPTKGGGCKSRAVVKDLKCKDKKTKDDVFAATPTFGVIKILMIFALAMGLCIGTFDVSTAFLHAPLEGKGGYVEELFVKPPAEYFRYTGLAEGSVYWKLKKAMYGLRGAPRAFQEYLQDQMEGLGFVRCQYESCVYRHLKKKLYAVTHVDDFMTFGNTKDTTWFYQEIRKVMLVKSTGNLDTEGSQVTFLGRLMTRAGNAVLLSPLGGYIETMLDLADLNAKTKGVAVPGLATMSTAMKNELDVPLAPLEHNLYRRIVGKVMWLCPIRPDITYAGKELSRKLVAPTRESWLRAKHLLKYLKATSDYVLEIRPKYQLGQSDTNSVDVETYVDSDWAG